MVGRERRNEAAKEEERSLRYGRGDRRGRGRAGRREFRSADNILNQT